ncbi:MULTISPECIES: ABC transporter substrate-binding protein [Halomonadaceae]|uniref:ABC transporter substrate-binding protein n=1 Tax=Halomonadaceae TaxID=28256 RepID=UPI00159734BF|nr:MULTISPECIES: ABC transporter substrate-binding protein [Halomonas]QJQ95878.1 polyamine ABC transporter substrate-binding protein [Halomonas sp. PA5]
MKRLTCHTVTLAGLVGLGITPALSAPLYIGSYGGSTEQAMRDIIIPAFLEQHEAEIVYVAGNSTDTLAKLQAQRGNQELDVVLMDDGPMYQGINLGFCASLNGMEGLDEVYDIARFPDDKAVGIGLVASGFAYNAELFERNGWAPPTSWGDLADEKYAGKLVVPSISNTYGVHALVMTARLNGGSETDIDPGFEFMQQQAAPNILSFEPSAGKMSEMFQNEEIALSVWGSGRLQALADTGFPGAFAYPEEGAVALMVAACAIEGSENPELAQAFITHLLSPESQRLLAETQGWGPAQRATELPEALAEKLPYGERVDQLVAVDWDVINPNRLEWTNRWNRQVER